MKKTTHYAFTSLLTLLLFATNSCEQAANTTKFIEPNISISFDSNYFKISDRYSNTTYGTESYDLTYQGNPSKIVRIHIKADHPVESFPKKERDSLILAGMEEMINTVNDTFSIISIDKQIREINGFSCTGFTGYDKIEKVYSSFIGCYHSSENDNTEIRYMSNGKDIEAEYKLLTSFLSGFHSYSAQQIASEDSIIKNKYTVVVTETRTIPDDLKYRPKTYIGIVSTKEKPAHPISEVRLNSPLGFEIFTPGIDGQLLIVSNDKEKGLATKNGELVLLNSFGKKVKVPFSFNYQNKGPL
jgi:hypothetical protein